MVMLTIDVWLNLAAYRC